MFERERWPALRLDDVMHMNTMVAFAGENRDLEAGNGNQI